MSKPELKVMELIGDSPTYAICTACGPTMKFHAGSNIDSPEDAQKRIEAEFQKHLKKYHSENSSQTDQQ
jgi:hypothetical protein